MLSAILYIINKKLAGQNKNGQTKMVQQIQEIVTYKYDNSTSSSSTD